MIRDRSGNYGNVYERYRNVLIWKEVPEKVQAAEHLCEIRAFLTYRSLLGAIAKNEEKAFEEFNPSNPKEVGVPNYQEALGYVRECLAAAETVQQHYLNPNSRMQRDAVVKLEQALVNEDFDTSMHLVEAWRCAVIRMTWDECPDLRDLGWRTSGKWEAKLGPSDV